MFHILCTRVNRAPVPRSPVQTLPCRVGPPVCRRLCASPLILVLSCVTLLRRMTCVLRRLKLAAFKTVREYKEVYSLLTAELANLSRYLFVGR